MKLITIIFTTIITLCTTSFISAQCGPTHVDPTPQIIGFCEGTTDTISFVSPGTCQGNYEYQVLNSTNTVVQAWSNIDMYISTPLSTETYTVEARCSTCPGTVVSDTFMIEVIEDPVIVADSFICYGTPANFSATGPPIANMSWWDSETGGNQLSGYPNYTSPGLMENDTVYMQVSGTVTSGAATGSILITEAGLHGFPGSTSADYLEISNLYSNPVNTTGWYVIISDSYSNINSVNSITWNLPSTFTPCSIVSKTDVSSEPNYWGNNILWNPNSPGWIAIVDDQGDIVDFISWGWTTAQLAGFSPTVNGNTLTLGTEWTGNSCSSVCTVNGGTPYSLSRNGSADSNTSADFVCQATSLNVVNPGLNCGWISSNITCPHEVIVAVDSLPSASAPDTTFLDCYADIPAPNSLIINDEIDDYSPVPSVQYMGEVSDGNMCPETLTRTYRVSDSCANYIEVEHIIIIYDSVAPTIDPAPNDLFIECYADLPVMDSLNWSDNCMGSGKIEGVEVSDGNTCPEVLIRTWSVTDTCGNTAIETQTITIFDSIAPIIDPAPANLSIQCPADLPPMVSLNWSDNCSGSGVLNGVEVSDGNTCPETIVRTWTISDGCGNTSTETQVIIINDDTPPTASNLPTLQLSVLPPADISVITDAQDNCGTPVVAWAGDSTDNGFCPENIIRTYSVTDDCGNVTLVTRQFIIGDNIPNVSFTASPTILDDFSDGIVHFNNETTGASIYEWDFDDTSANSFDFNTSHEFDITESTHYEVWLVATSKFDCVDSARVVIEVFQEIIYFIPNSFTPNNDGVNQIFHPIFAAGFNPNDYNFKVYNRWGQILFESNDHTIGWDGTYAGKIVPEGSYLYTIEFGLAYSEERKIISGSFNLFK